jgi:hypothetical protein
MKISMNRVIKLKKTGDGQGMWQVRVRKHTGFWWRAGRRQERRRCKWEGNIKMGVQEIGWREAWTGLIWLRIWTRWPDLVKAVKNLGGPMKFWEFLD